MANAKAKNKASWQMSFLAILLAVLFLLVVFAKPIQLFFYNLNFIKDAAFRDAMGAIFDKKGAELLFNHLSLRTGRKATIITTNLSFDRWQEIFGDPVLTAALVDRITHKAHLVNMNGESYRIKETKKMMNIQ